MPEVAKVDMKAPILAEQDKERLAGVRPRRSGPKLNLICALVLSATALAIPCLASPSAAWANPANSYNVFPCEIGAPPPALSEISFEEVNAPNFNAGEKCTENGELILESTGNGATGFRDRAAWILHAPPLSAIRELEMNMAFPGEWPTTSLLWSADADGHILESSRAPVAEEHALYKVGPVNGPGTFGEGTQSFAIELECFQPGGCAKDKAVGSVATKLRVALDDLRSPTITSLGGSLFGPGPLNGTVSAELSAEDVGSGVFFAELLIDGQKRVKLAPDSGGKCRQPFTTFVPCLATADFAYSVDTTALTDGIHSKSLRVCDATGIPEDTTRFCPGTQTTQFTVHNTPTSKTPPAISGTAKLGVPLTSTPGTWEEASPASLGFQFGFQWLRCPATVTDPNQCAPIPGAVGTTYTPVAADLGKRAIAKVTATLNAAGHASAIAFSAPSDVIADAQPINTARPSLSGSANVGGHLAASTGTWENPTAAFAYQWLRCPPSVATGSETGCTPIAGATSAQYAPLTQDIGQRDVAKVTATNAFGSGTALSAPSEPVAQAKGGEGGGGNAPQTKIAKHPRTKTALRSAKFTFGSDQPGSSFQCKLDRKPFKACRSPFKAKVKPGRHAFSVRALSPQGLADPTPAFYSWTVGKIRKGHQ